MLWHKFINLPYHLIVTYLSIELQRNMEQLKNDPKNTYDDLYRSLSYLLELLIKYHIHMFLPMQMVHLFLLKIDHIESFNLTINYSQEQQNLKIVIMIYFSI